MSYLETKLHPDLQPYLNGGELRHPLLQLDIGEWTALYPIINQIISHIETDRVK
jgi:hypothetical protein